MADNTTINAGSGGDSIATDEIGGVKHQRVKVQYGADGSATDVSPAAPLPIRSTAEEAAFGAVGTLTTWNRFGANADVDAAANEDVWSNGGVWLNVINTSGETVNVVSTSTDDDGSPAGTGAQTVEVFGLDGTYNVQSETVTMNGTSNVATANTYIVVYRLIVKTVGSGATNAGAITATGGTSSYVYAHITAGEAQTLQATHVVPASTTGYLYNYYVGVAGGTSVNVTFTLKAYDTDTYPLWRPLHKISVANGEPYQHTFVSPLSLTAKTYLKLEADSSANNVDVFGGFTLVIDG
jgi:hypothetical protein